MTWNPAPNKVDQLCSECRTLVPAGKGRWWSDWGPRPGQRVMVTLCPRCYERIYHVKID
jgi:hypothetical protein